MLESLDRGKDITIDVCQIGNDEFWKVLGIQEKPEVTSQADSDAEVSANQWVQGAIDAAVGRVLQKKKER